MNRLRMMMATALSIALLAASPAFGMQQKQTSPKKAAKYAAAVDRVQKKRAASKTQAVDGTVDYVKLLRDAEAELQKLEQRQLTLPAETENRSQVLLDLRAEIDVVKGEIQSLKDKTTQAPQSETKSRAAAEEEVAAGTGADVSQETSAQTEPSEVVVTDESAADQDDEKGSEEEAEAAKAQREAEQKMIAAKAAVQAEIAKLTEGEAKKTLYAELNAATTHADVEDIKGRAAAAVAKEAADKKAEADAAKAKAEKDAADAKVAADAAEAERIAKATALAGRKTTNETLVSQIKEYVSGRSADARSRYSSLDTLIDAATANSSDAAVLKDAHDKLHDAFEALRLADVQKAKDAAAEAEAQKDATKEQQAFNALVIRITQKELNNKEAKASFATTNALHKVLMLDASEYQKAVTAVKAKVWFFKRWFGRFDQATQQELKKLADGREDALKTAYNKAEAALGLKANVLRPAVEHAQKGMVTRALIAMNKNKMRTFLGLTGTTLAVVLARLAYQKHFASTGY